jgi:NADH dehydrogenase
MLEAAPTILNMLTDRKLAQKAEDYMIQNGVQLIKNAKVTGVTKDSVVFADGTSIPTKTLIWTAGVKNKAMLEKFGLDYEAGRGGRVKVDEYMHILGHNDIFAAGDAVEWVDPKDGPTPQTVQGGESMAAAAVKNITAEIKNSPLVPFKRVDWGYAVSIGSHYTVAALFGKFNFGGFFANLVKHGINIYYFLQIHSLGSIVKYLNNEIFRMNNGREPFNGVVSQRGNTLWSLPLRILIGFAFLNAAVGNSWNLPLLDSGTFTNFLNIFAGSGMLLGLFSFPAALIGFLLSFIFAVGHGFTIFNSLLMLGSFALLNGTGRGFGLDHWVFPLVKKLWKSIWYGKESTQYKEVDLNND